MRLVSTKALVALLGIVASCGGTTAPGLTPQLPADGDVNTRKPGQSHDDTGSDPWAGRTDLIVAPKSKEPSALALPAIESFRLRNGLEVMVVKDATVPVVAMRLAVRAGRENESRDKVGVSSFVAAMLDKGTKARSAPAIADAIDFVGGALSASADYDGTYVSCRVMAKELGTCLQLLPDVVINPTFPEGEMPNVRDGLMAEVRGRRDDAGQLAGLHFANALWGAEHPRGWSMSATTIQALQQKDLREWHRAWFKPNNAVLAVAGDVDANALKRDLERAFAGWRPGKVSSTRGVEPPALAGVRVRLVDKPDQTQSHIRVGEYGLALGDRDFYDALVYNYALGGGAFSSRLMKVVRSEAGKTYGASSRFDKDKSRGAFWVTTFTRNAETRATIDLLLQEIEKMAKAGPTAKEVADAIANIAGSYSTSFQSAEAFATALLAAKLSGFGPEYVRDYALKVGAVTAESAAAAARARLDPSNLVIVIVGAAKDVKPQLDAAGWKYEVVDYMDPVADYERKAMAEQQSAAVSEQEQAKAKEVLEQALATKGGAKLAKVKSLRLQADATLSLGPQTVPVEMARIMMVPDKLQLSMKVMGGTQVVTLDGDTGWVKQEMGGQSQIIDLPATEMRAAKSQLWRDQELVLLRFKDAGTTAKLVSSTKTHDIVELVKDKWAVRLHINKKTKLLDEMSYQEGGEMSSETYGDYRPVAGIMIAHSRKTTQKMMGKNAVFDIKIKKVELNPAVDPAVFTRPAN